MGGAGLVLASPAPPDRPGPVALWRLYLAAVASCGAYLPFWVWRTARQYGIGVRYRGTATWWAVGSVVAPVAAAVLYEFNRRALSPPGSRGRAVRPSLALLAIFLLWSVTPLSGFFVAFAVLVPIPFLFVQRNIDRAAAREGERAHPRRPLRLAMALGIGLGLPLTSFVAWTYDWPAFRTGMGRRLASGDLVVGSSGLYTLTLPGHGWRRVPPGTIGDPSADLELVGPGLETWVVVYTSPRPDSNLDTAVSYRRTELFEGGATLQYQERRYFIGGWQDLVPASLVTCEVGAAMSRALYVVVTVETEGHVVELLGYTAEPLEQAGPLQALLETAAEPAEAGS